MNTNEKIIFAIKKVLAEEMIEDLREKCSNVAVNLSTKEWGYKTNNELSNEEYVEIYGKMIDEIINGLEIRSNSD